jgi:hypothetical protein
MQNTGDIPSQVTATLGDHPADFDVDGIVEEIGDTYGRDLDNIDSIPSEKYWEIVRRHETVA